jgi:hypothetical protein
LSLSIHLAPFTSLFPTTMLAGMALDNWIEGSTLRHHDQ